jgi:hypothetical protein
VQESSKNAESVSLRVLRRELAGRTALIGTLRARYILYINMARKLTSGISLSVKTKAGTILVE